MSHFDDVRRMVEGEPSAPQVKPRFQWVDRGDQVEVLWTDSDDKPFLAKGELKGIRIPSGPEGGPIDLVVDTGNGETALSLEDVVGITPASQTPSY